MPSWLIESITLRLCHVRPHQVNVYSDGHRDPYEVPIMVVQITAGGESGYGEFVPISLMYKQQPIERETIDEWAVLCKTCEALINRDCRDLRMLIPPSLNIEAANPLVDGIDFALHDLVGRLSNLPVWALLGGRRQPWVQAMTVIHTLSPTETLERARELHARCGYRWLKLKPNCNLDADRETMSRIRHEVEPTMQFVIDPNESLKMDAQGVVEYINALRPHGLEICEDPIAADWNTYRWIQERTDVSLMLDVRARSLQNVLEIVNHRCARMINIHANWAGGFSRALQKANLAAMAGIETYVGSTYYTGCGAAAYQTLASLVPGRHLCEQANASEYVQMIAIKREYEVKDGLLYIPDAPGLGVEIDHRALQTMTVRDAKIS